MPGVDFHHSDCVRLQAHPQAFGFHNDGLYDGSLEAAQPRGNLAVRVHDHETTTSLRSSRLWNGGGMPKRSADMLRRKEMPALRLGMPPRAQKSHGRLED